MNEKELARLSNPCHSRMQQIPMCLALSTAALHIHKSIPVQEEAMQL